MKKISLLLAAVLLVGLLAGCGNTAAEGEAPVQSVSMICGLESAGLVDRFAGLVSPRSETEIKKDEKKVLGDILVKEGDDVKAGQILFTYDSQAAELDLEKAQLELEQLKNTVTAKESQKAQLEKDKAKAGASEQLSYSLEIQEADTAIREANYNAALKEKEIQKLQDGMNNLEVTSPVDGRIQSLNVDGGHDNRGNELPFMSIMETGVYRVKGLVNEANVGTVSEGMNVIVRSRVDNSVTWTGVIDKIDWENPQKNTNDYYDSGNSDEMTSSNKYPFYVELNSDDGLLLGQHVYIEPDYGQDAVEDANTIRLPACYINDVDGSAWVWAQNDKGLLEKRSLTLGEHDEDMDTYVVESGLTAEDYIAFPDDTLKAGMTCVLYDENAFNDGANSDGMTDTGMTDGGEGMVDTAIPEEGITDAAIPDEGFAGDAAVDEAVPEDGAIGSADASAEEPAAEGVG